MFLSSRVTPWVGQLLDCVLTFLLKLPFARTILQGLLLPVLKLLIAVAQQVELQEMRQTQAALTNDLAIWALSHTATAAALQHVYHTGGEFCRITAPFIQEELAVDMAVVLKEKQAQLDQLARQISSLEVCMASTH